MAATEVEQMQSELSSKERIRISNKLLEQEDPALQLLAYFIVDPEDISLA